MLAMRPSLRWLSLSWAMLAIVVPTGALQAAGLEVVPAKVELRDAFARRQLLVDFQGEDVTHAVKYKAIDPQVISVDAAGFITPLANGTTRVEIQYRNATRLVPVTVQGLDQTRPVDFSTEIEPLLSRLGCNAGGCHGKASGQNGFKLSLFGFDTAFDHMAIAEEGRGRRIFPAAPRQSLLLLKAVGGVPHGGGKRMEVDSEPYRLMEAWIKAGAPVAAPDAPKVTKLKIVPGERVFQAKQTQQVAVIAEYSNGTERDVTRAAEYGSNLDVVAAVSETGLISADVETGEAAIMARYMGHVAVCRVLRPAGSPLKEIPEFEPANFIDQLVVEKWKKLGLRPSPPCDDATFLRRVTLDLAGRLPTVEEARDYFAATDPQKRVAVVDRLLAGPDYPAYFAMKWGSILRNSNLAGADKASYAFHNWIKEQIASNRPYDEFVRGIVAAAGEWPDAPAINWFWQSRDDQLHQVTADTAQVFLGLRLQCAKCHHHPYERWSQDDYYGLAGFYTRLGRKSFGEPPPYFSASQVTIGERHPLTGQPIEPKYLDGEVAKFLPEQDPRHGLVDWMARPENPFFARTLVNRMWGHFFARGIVQEIDDMRETNPPSNPALLDALAREFVERRYDVQHIIRLIVNSRTYQLSSVPLPENQSDRQNFARYYARRLPAEVLFDAVCQATGTKSGFGNMSTESRAVDLPHERFYSPFLDTFDRPRRVTGCECERSTGATLSQALLLANSDDLEGRLMNQEGRVHRLVQAQKTQFQMIEELYLVAFSRYPTRREIEEAARYMDQESPNNVGRGAADVLWALINSREFVFNH